MFHTNMCIRKFANVNQSKDYYKCTLASEYCLTFRYIQCSVELIFFSSLSFILRMIGNWKPHLMSI